MSINNKLPIGPCRAVFLLLVGYRFGIYPHLSDSFVEMFSEVHIHDHA